MLAYGVPLSTAKNRRLVVHGLCIAAIVAFGSPLFAASADSLINRAKKEIRGATQSRTTSGKTTQAASADGALPSNAAFRLKQVGASLDSVEDNLKGLNGKVEERHIQAAQRNLKQARQRLDDFYKQYSALKEHPEAKAMETRLAETEKKVGEADKSRTAGIEKDKEAKAGAAASSADWIKRLQPYVANNPGAPNYNKEKYFIASATEEQGEMEKRLKLYAEAQAAFDEYNKASFPSGKTDDLQQIEKELARALKQFKDSVVESANRRLGDADRRLDECLRFLDKQEAKKDPKDLPLPLQKDQLQDVLKRIEAASILVPKDDPRLPAMAKKAAEIEKRDAAIRQLRVDQTRMIADKFKGKEIEDLKKKANEVVTAKFEKAKILRTTLISPDWKEESVIEWTDTTRSALQFRVTRSVTAQVAANVENGCFIYTCDISKDRRSDGSFGELKGHIMFTDPIVEANVTK